MPEVPAPRSRRPILVTGVPRSGTTWLSRWLADGAGMALTGREPMNTRTPGQYALARTLTGWTRLTDPTPRQRRALVLAYRGLTPLVYSRYGSRQWSAPLPWTRLVVKDPFAVLSIPAIVRHTGAQPVLVYRHPGAVLSSYRRMGWSPDLEELQRVVEDARASGGPDLPDLPRPGEGSPAAAMGRFWATLHDLALADTAAAGTDLVVVAHHEVAAAGPEGGRRLADRLGVGWTPAMAAELAKEAGGAGAGAGGAGAGVAGGAEPAPPAADPTVLHNFDRAPAEVADAWRRKLDASEIADVEGVTEATRAALEERRLRLT